MESHTLSPRRQLYDKGLRVVLYFCGFLTCALLVLIIGYIFYRGVPFISWELLSTQSSYINDTIGILPNILNTLYIILLSMVIVLPLGVGAAIYLTEYATNRRLVAVIEFATETLTGIPSIIFGLVGMLFFIQMMGLKTGVLAGGLTLVVMILPTIVRTTQESLKTVPNSYREGALAMGAGKWHMVRTVVLPNSVDGIITGCIIACVLTVYILRYVNSDDQVSLDNIDMRYTTILYTEETDPETGDYVELQRLQTIENRIWVDYDQIPRHMIDAAVAIEDKRFREHNGVDWKRTFGAFVNMFIPIYPTQAGGSTITQQLIKNVTTEDDVTVQRKLVEIFRALDLEKEYTKEEIMEWYLNVVYFGEGASGVQMAANTYFGKDVRDLTLAQCASIIGITNNPSRYSPFASVENNKKRTKTILYEMYDQDYISHEEYTAAVAEVDNDELHFIRGENEVYQQEIYSYYVEMVGSVWSSRTC